MMHEEEIIAEAIENICLAVAVQDVVQVHRVPVQYYFQDLVVDCEIDH
jgi:hypothetical protein